MKFPAYTMVSIHGESDDIYIGDIHISENKESNIGGIFYTSGVFLDWPTYQLRRCKLSRDQEFNGGVRVPKNTEVIFRFGKDGLDSAYPLNMIGPLPKKQSFMESSSIEECVQYLIVRGGCTKSLLLISILKMVELDSIVR